MNTNLVICIFGSEDRNKYTHYRMRTLPLLEELQNYFTHCYFNPNKNIISKFSKNTFILIHIKFKKIPKPFLKMKKKLVIWDIIDALANSTSKTLLSNKLFQEKYKISNIINCPNNAMKSFVKKHNSLHRNIYAIPHNWDPRMIKYFEKHNNQLNALKEPKIGYLGTPNSKKEEKMILKIPEINFIGPVIKKNNIGNFNCLCSLRDEKSSFGKPATKSFVAASLNSLIIAYKHEYGVYDFYGNEYPYYIKKNSKKTDKENIKDTINYLKETYNTDVWNKAVEISKNVKGKTSIEYVALEFKNLILKYL
tara:strand:+ start:104 stop:1027 length:924 start_codon:yes stop_codon:yes gene_type:complete